MERHCICCNEKFQPLVNVKRHQYCRKKACQQARKARWQRSKVTTDAHYREYRKKAQESWCKKNPEYWRRYRASHPAYRLREQQRQRLRRRPGTVDATQPSLRVAAACVAKTDVSSPIKSGTYTLQPVGVAKMDSLLVQLIVVQRGYETARVDL